ncbi:MAG: hypothetical protein OXF20_03640 [Gammaproteobacteria bacterium]|nr:hypothetical protein [Gammaproteobacteria bacterium]
MDIRDVTDYRLVIDMNTKDEEYLGSVLEAIRVSAQYKPKFGLGAKGGGLDLEQFQQLYRGDSFYKVNFFREV